MLWSILKIVIFIAIAAALAFGAAALLETPGEVRIAFGTREIFLSPLGFIIGLVALVVVALVVLRIVALLIAVARFLLGDETAISRHFRRGRERRGFDALSAGLVALAAGDGRAARKQASKAERLLDHRPDVTRLLGAQVAELNGDTARATDYYKGLLENDRTRFVGVKGLMQQRLEAGDTDTALALARKAFALRPANPGVLRTLFDLQSKKEDWGGARETLNASIHAKLLPRDVGTRRDAVLSLADARAALADGNAERGNEAARQANKLAPTLVPAAALAARVEASTDHKRKAAKILTRAWKETPHPELAAAFAEIEPGETPAARRKRFDALLKQNPDDPETRMLAAELALADEDFPAARKAMGDLAEREPTTRSLAIMAAIERGQGAPEAVVRGWLAKALGASRGPQWVCTACSHVHTAWEPVCENCGAFDTLDWKTPPQAEDTGLAESAMLPLIVGSLAAEQAAATSEQEQAEPGAEAAGERPKQDVEDAELAEGGGTANARA